MSYIKSPGNIEKRSFEIISEELGDKINNFKEEELPVIKRVIHTTADFEYADLIEFINNPVDKAKKSIKSSCKIYCDTNMIVNGLSKIALKHFNCEAYCLVSDTVVINEAKERNITRSMVAMEKAGKDPNTKNFYYWKCTNCIISTKRINRRKENKQT